MRINNIVQIREYTSQGIRFGVYIGEVDGRNKVFSINGETVYVLCQYFSSGDKMERSTDEVRRILLAKIEQGLYQPLVGTRRAQ